MYTIEYLDLEENIEFEEIIKKVIEQCFKEEKLENSKLNISITLTTPENIRKINKEYRNVDNETDVLSFPIFEKEELDKKILNNKFEYEDILGDIVISIKRVEEQAKEYGHSIAREMGFLTVHGLLHLLGYDHMNKEEEKVMFTKQEEILDAYGLKRWIKKERAS